MLRFFYRMAKLIAIPRPIRGGRDSSWFKFMFINNLRAVLIDIFRNFATKINNMDRPKETDINALKTEVENIFGAVPKSPSDFDRLSATISAGGKTNIAVSTLKRIWGYVPSPHTPTYTTLSVLARFVGYRDWDSFRLHLNCDADSGFTPDCIIVAADEKIGATFRAEWTGRKWCEIEKIAEPTRFRVIETMNIKLQPGDEITITTIAIGDMFVATDCTRGSKPLGTYAGARKDGVTAVHRLGSL